MLNRFFRRFAPSVIRLGNPTRGSSSTPEAGTPRDGGSMRRRRGGQKRRRSTSNRITVRLLRYFGMKRSAGEILVTLDGDGQNDPADIPRLLAALKDRDMVAGVRARRQDSWLRLAMSRLANSIRSRLLDDGLLDAGCALKAFRSEVVESLLPIRTLYSFMGAMAAAAEFRLCQIEVVHRSRRHGQSKYGFSVFWWKPLIDMIGIYWFSERRFPHQIEWRSSSEP
jgi:glycosyltransferase involved in cell wall biosynthesis